MSIKLTPEEIKALYAYIYGGSCTQEEYQIGAEIHDKVFGMVEKEIKAKGSKVIKCVDPATGETTIISRKEKYNCSKCYYIDENNYCSMVDQYIEPSDDACGSFRLSAKISQYPLRKRIRTYERW